MQPGTRLGTYEILATLGAGGMGEVYRAHDTHLNRDVALKVLLNSVVGDPERVARFTREAHVLASLNHPHIAHLYGFEAGPPTAFLVMELVEGPTLAEVIKTSPGGLPLAQVLAIARQIAEALDTAHEQGIIHRDLKPANIKVRADGVVKVLDFGLARTLDPGLNSGPGTLDPGPTMTSPAMTAMGMILGTAAYMAPEQAKGRAVTKRADIWAFGVVLFEMLTGTRAFDGEDITDVLAAVLKDEPNWAALPATTPPGLRRLLRRCLAKDPRQRLRDMGDVRLELEEGAVGTAEPAAVPTAAPSLLTRAYPWLAVVMSVVSIVLLAVLFLRGNTGGLRGEQTPIRLSLAPPTGTTFARRTVPQLSPDGQHVAMVAVDGLGVAALWIRTLGSEGSTRLEGTDGAVQPFWSPDGRSLGFFAAGKLKCVDVAGGLPRTLALVASPNGGTWGRDGTILFGSFPGPILRVNVKESSRPATPATTIDRSRKEATNFWPQILPDGRHFIFWADGEAQGIQLASLDGPERRMVTPSPVSGVYTSGQLFLVREGTLVARTFDVTTGQVGVETHVASGVAINPVQRQSLLSVSIDGRLVYTDETWSQSRLVRLDRHGREVGVVGPATDSALFSLSPESSGGLLVAEDRPDKQNVTRNLWTVTVPGGQSARLSSDNFGSETYPVWSADGTRLIYQWFKDGPADLYERPLSGRVQPRLIYHSEETKSPTDWSLDGRYVVYQTSHTDAERGTNYELWLLPLSSSDATRPLPFRPSRFNESGGRFSPDSKWLAYRSDESGPNEVYVARVPDGAPVQMSTNGGTRPEWRNDGTELYYFGPDGWLMSVALPSKDPLKKGTPTRLFKLPFGIPVQFNQGSIYAALPGGQEFLMLVPVDTPAPFTVLLNWSASARK